MRYLIEIWRGTPTAMDQAVKVIEVGLLICLLIVAIAAAVLGIKRLMQALHGKEIRGGCRGVKCPHEKLHNHAEGIYCVRRGRGDLPSLFRCGCGCEFRWFSAAYSQIVRAPDGLRPSRRQIPDVPN